MQRLENNISVSILQGLGLGLVSSMETNVSVSDRNVSFTSLREWD